MVIINNGYLLFLYFYGYGLLFFVEYNNKKSRIYIKFRVLFDFLCKIYYFYTKNLRK
jgi:hypothetical protein